MKLKYFGCSLLQLVLFNMLLVVPIMIVFILSISNVNSAWYKDSGAYARTVEVTDKLFKKLDIDKSIFDSQDLYKLHEELAVESMENFISGKGEAYNVDKVTDFLKKNEDKIIESRGEGLTEENIDFLSKYADHVNNKVDEDEFRNDKTMIIAKFFSSKILLIIFCTLSILLILLIAFILKGYFENALIFYSIPSICSGCIGAFLFSSLIEYHGEDGDYFGLYKELFGSMINIYWLFIVLGIGLIVVRIIYKRKANKKF